MIDYLLKFSSKKTAHTFALSYGFATREPYTEKIIVLSNGSDYSLHEYGSHIALDPDTGDGKYWIALRLSRETGLPTACNKYVVWWSGSGLARPKNDSTIPNISWA